MYHEKCKFVSLSSMLAIILILSVSGCATTKSEQAQTLSLALDSVAFITLKVSNQYKPSYQPFAKSVIVLNDDGKRLRAYP